MKTVIAMLNRSFPLQADFELSVINPPHSPLTVVGIGMGPRGLPAIAVWQYRARGARMLREPEMHFEVEWSRGEVADLYPYSWHSEYAELDEVAVTCEGVELDGRHIVRSDNRMIADHRAFALIWDKELVEKSFEQAYYRFAFLSPPIQNAHA